MQKRKSNIELLRIIAMLMIVTHHYAVHGILHVLEGGGGEYQTGTLGHKILVCLMVPGGTIGTAVFFIISGYFLVKKDSVSVKKVVKEIIYYSIICSAVAIVINAFGVGDVSIGSIVRTALVPVTNGGVWWFATAYVILLMLTPFLNTIVNKCSLKQYICILVMFWLFPYSMDIILSGEYSNISKAVLFYLIGAFIGRFIDAMTIHQHTLLLGFSISWILYAAISFMVNENIFVKVGNEINESLFTVIGAVSLFMMFRGLEFTSDFVNTVANTTFGVYLISDSILLRNYIWNGIWKADLQYTDKYFALWAAISICVTFIICSSMDYIRSYYLVPWIK